MSQAPVDDGDSDPVTTHHSQLTTDESVSCGVGAAYLLLQRLGRPVSVEEIEAASPVRADAPLSFADLQLVFENLGFQAEGLRMSLQKLDRPVIAFRPHPEGKVGHFVVVEPIRDEGSGNREKGSGDSGSEPSTLNPGAPGLRSPQLFLLLDPLGQPVKVPADRLAKSWDGRVLLVYPKGSSSPRALIWVGQARWPIGMALGISVVIMVAGVSYLVRHRVASGESTVPLTPGAPGLRSPALSPQAGRGGRFAWVTAGLAGRRWKVLAPSLAAAGLCAGGGYFVLRYGSESSDANPRAEPFSSGNEISAARIDLAELGTAILVENGTRVDFGDVKLGDPLSHTIEVKNVGQADLPLEKLRMNCACNAQVEYERDVCRPGETAGIQISTKAVGYGPQRKPIPFAVSHDGQLETLFTLDVRYRVAWLEQVQFVPSRLELGEISSAAEVDRELELIVIGPPDGTTPELVELESESAGIRAEIVSGEPVQVNARTARTTPAQRVVVAVRIVVNPRALPTGRLHGHVTARTSIGEAKLHVTGQVCAPIVASPASLLVEKSRTEASRHVVRLRAIGHPVDRFHHAQRDGYGLVLSAVATAPGVSCAVQPDGNEVEIIVEPDAELSAESGIEIVAQAGAARETVRVPLVEF
jgi:hypothetical protein